MIRPTTAPLLAAVLFGLVPLGGILLYAVIPLLRRSIFGPLVVELPMSGDRATFVIHAPGLFGIWQKWPMFSWSPLDTIQPVVLEAASDVAVPLRHSWFRPHCNDGATAWFEFRRFRAAAGSYRLELRPGSGVPTPLERFMRRVLPLPRAAPDRCAIQVRESHSAAWLVLAIPLLVLAGCLVIGGLVGGILVLVVPAAAADPVPADPVAAVRRLEHVEVLDVAAVARLLEAGLDRDDEADTGETFRGRPRADGAVAAAVQSIELRSPPGPEALVGPLLMVDFFPNRGPAMADVVSAFGEADDVGALPPGHPASLSLAYRTPRGRLIFRIGPAPARQVVSVVIDRTGLTATRAAELAKRAGPLRLDALETIPVDAARALAPHRGLLSLGGVRRVDEETAAALAGHAGSLAMHGLEAIDSDPLFAKLLGDLPSDTTFHLFVQDQLRSLTDAQAAAIVGHRFSAIMIPRATLSDRQAAALAACPGELCVGAAGLSDVALGRLADRPAPLAVVARTLTVEQARILAKTRGPLTLHVIDLPGPAAAILDGRTGPLTLSTGPEPDVP